MLMAYASVAAFFLVAIGFIVGSLLAGRLLRPNNMYPEKLETYECGEAPVGPAWFNFNPRFYIIALIYIVFDVEIAFVYPVATVFNKDLSQFLLMWDDARRAPSPREAVLDYCQSTYEAAANLAKWDRAALERGGAAAR